MKNPLPSQILSNKNWFTYVIVSLIFLIIITIIAIVTQFWVLTAIPIGFLFGVGAALVKGCVVGNIMSGWALMSIGTVLFALVVVLTNWITTYFYLMGGTIRGLGSKS